MEKPLDQLDLIYQNYIDMLSELETDAFAGNFYKALKSGDNTVYQKNISETKTFDETWIKTIESYFPSIDKITKNPKSALKYDEEIVAIEKARKVNSNSIRHLAAHTQFIKEVRRDGTVMPSRIMVTEPDIDYGIYENRFIMTLIDRLYVFVRSRLDTIKENIESFQKKHFNYQSNFKLNDTTVDLTFDLTLKDGLDDKALIEYNESLLKRVEHLDKLVLSLKGSGFMQLMANQKKIVPPIIKTQIIQKNVDFRNAYLLWLFLDRYNLVEYDVTLKEKDLKIDNDYIDDIQRLALTSFMTVTANQKKRKQLYDDLDLKEYRKKHFNVSKKQLKHTLEDPSGIMIEDTNLNQYYLEQNKQIFKKNIEEQIERSSTFEVGLKRAIRDLINITNAVYESHFEVSTETDVFKQLVKNDDPEVLLDELKHKQRIARIIRETKEVDYNNSIRLERSLLKEIERNDQRLINKISKRQKSLIKEKAELEKLKKEKQLAKENDKLLQEQLKYTSQLRDDLSLEKIQTDEKLKLSADERNKIENEKFQIEKEKIDKLFKSKTDKIKIQYEQETKRQTAELEKEFKQFEKEQNHYWTLKKKEIEANYKKELIQIKADRKEKEEKLRIKQKSQQQNHQVKLQSKFDKMKERTIKKLENEKTAYENLLKLKIQKETKKDIK